MNNENHVYEINQIINWEGNFGKYVKTPSHNICFVLCCYAEGDCGYRPFDKNDDTDDTEKVLENVKWYKKSLNGRGYPSPFASMKLWQEECKKNSCTLVESYVISNINEGREPRIKYSFDDNYDDNYDNDELIFIFLSKLVTLFSHKSYTSECI